ncbi:MAG: hypothetical protein WBL61_09495 [Bryobacteraceae bacterium]
MPKMLNPALVPTGARRLVRVLALVFPVAVIAAAANPPWTQQQELAAPDGAVPDSFGQSVSVSGDTAVIGDPGAINDQGVAYVYVRSGGVWSQQQELIASDGVANDYFGQSVSVSGDTAVIGAWGKDARAGAAYVFVRSGGVWGQQQELTASDGVANDYFGQSVSVSGDTALIAAYGKISAKGAAYVFVRSGGAWSQQQELAASDGAPNDIFGDSVSVSGDTAVIGARGKTINPQAVDQGAVYVFVRSGDVWAQQQELTASDGAANGYFGDSVSVSGDTAVIGAPGGGSALQGAAYVFVKSGGVWSQQQELTASDGRMFDGFGLPVSLNGGTVVIGATRHAVYGDQGTGEGAAYVFAQSGAAWGQQQELTTSDGVWDGFFGYSVSVSGDTAVIAALQTEYYPGAAYVFIATQPAITGVSVSGGGTSIAQNAWVEIYGANLAPASVGASGLAWSSAPSFAFGQMPTQLQGVSAAVNGKPAYIYFISPTQVNVLTPLDSTTGPVAVTVNNGTTTSAAFTANMQAVSPGFLRFGDGIHIAAEHANYDLLGPASMSVPGYTFTPATPGETILLFGDGFGLPSSTLTRGSDVQLGALPTWPQVTFGGTTATVQYAGLISPGLYQINVVVPSTAPGGDNQVIATYAGASSPTGAMIPVSR